MKFNRIPLITILFITILIVSCAPSQTLNKDTTQLASTIKKPKNIILLIGDGMGLSEVSASFFYNKEASNFDRFKTIGLIKTSASSDLITDSAASATAFASGIKTYNGAIGVNNDTLAVETIVEQVSRKGLSTGLIATSSIVHATPASFYAHTKSRSLYEEIASFLPISEIDFFAGGGIKYFNNRTDNQDLLLQLSNNGFEVHTKELPTTITSQKHAILLAQNGMPKMTEGRGDFLINATKLALQSLSENEEGFFLMIESSQIDWGGHNNDAEYLINEVLDFDTTIGTVLDFASANEETLVIVTADHETGGFTLATDNGDYNKIKPTFSTTGHSATMVPVFAEGPGSSIFGGIYENTAIYEKMMQLFSK